MKLSTIMLVISVLLVLGVITAYNFSLKAAYLKGTFRDRFGEHTFTKLNNVKQLHLNAANMIGMSIEHGEQEGVWILNEVKDQVKIYQNGDAAFVDFVNSDPKTYRLINAASVVLVVNKLNELKSHNYPLKSKDLENYYGELRINGLTGDSFNMVIAERANVHMNGNQFKSFKAVVGGDKFWSSLIISGDNRLDTAYFDVRKSSLELQNPAILVPHYKFGDSSRIELWGRSAQRFAK